MHHTTEELEAHLTGIRDAPRTSGTVELIVSRPAPGERVVHDDAELDVEVGLVGDTWSIRPTRRTGAPDPDAQLNIMSARAVAAIAGDPERWALAGDQLFLDLDLSGANLPAGTRLRVGEAVIEVTEQPHTGCAKFTQRFGLDAMRLVNSEVGRELNLRGICARVVAPGSVRRGDRVEKIVEKVPGQLER